MPAFLARLNRTIVALVVVFNLAPLVVIVGSSFSGSPLLEFPPTSFSLDWYAAAFANERWLRALLFSTIVAVIVSALATFVCFLAALVTVRTRFPGRFLFELAALTPLILPHAATALVLFRLAQVFGLLGKPSGIVLAHSLMAVPFAYLLCVAGLRKVEPALEEAAMALGAPPLMVFRRVTLPLMKTAIIGSFLFCFLLSFDEATVALFLRGIDTITLPVAVFMEIQDNATPLVSAISVLLILLTIVIIWITKRLVGLQLYINQRV